MPVASRSQYEADINWLRGEFERWGEIKTFFNLIEKRGMLFITYVRGGAAERLLPLILPPQFDLRHAEQAKNAMHGSRINTRTVRCSLAPSSGRPLLRHPFDSSSRHRWTCTTACQKRTTCATAATATRTRGRCCSTSRAGGSYRSRRLDKRSRSLARFRGSGRAIGWGECGDDREESQDGG